MPSLTGLLIGGVLPGLIALALLGLPRLSGHQRIVALSALLAPLFVALAFLPAPIVVNGKHDLWPLNAAERAIAIALAAGALGAVGRALARKGHAPAIAAIGSGAFAALAVLIALHPHAVSTGLLVGVCAAAGLWTSLAAVTLARAEAARPGLSTPLMLALTLFAASLVMLFSAIGTFAQQVGALVAITTSVALISLWKRIPVLGVSGYGVVLSILAYFVVGAWQLSRNPAIGALAIVVLLPVAIPFLVRFGATRTRRIASWIAIMAGCLGAIAWGYSIYSDALQAAPAW